MTDLLQTLEQAVQRAAVIRLTLRLKPAMNDGLVYPPTYDEGQHLFRPAWIDGEARDAVLLDSVQSQANRIEGAIKEAHRRSDIPYPDIQVLVKTPLGEEHYSILDLSHRIYDAALRMCTVEGQLFSQSAVGAAVYRARADLARSLFEHAPITLALGGWDSHGGGGPLVAKLPRLLTSEIVGLDAKPVERGAVKFDPMDIRKDAGPVFTSADPVRRFETDKERAADRKDKGKRPSEVGLGNVPNYGKRGAVITEAIQTSVISCTAARRLRFEHPDGSFSDDLDLAGRTATIGLGLYGLLAQMEAGYSLRSGCDLLPLTDPSLEIVGRNLQDVTTVPISAALARDALLGALAHATAQGMSWRPQALTAMADDRLNTLIERSRRSQTEES